MDAVEKVNATHNLDRYFEKCGLHVSITGVGDKSIALEGFLGYKLQRRTFTSAEVANVAPTLTVPAVQGADQRP